MSKPFLVVFNQLDTTMYDKYEKSRLDQFDGRLGCFFVYTSLFKLQQQSQAFLGIIAHTES